MWSDQTESRWLAVAADVLNAVQREGAVDRIVEALRIDFDAVRVVRRGPEGPDRTADPSDGRDDPGLHHLLVIDVLLDPTGRGRDEEGHDDAGRQVAYEVLRSAPFSDKDAAHVARLTPLLRGLERVIAGLRSGGVPIVLTPRERTVLDALAGGSTAAGLAAGLRISPRTVHKHQEHLYRKLGAVDRLSAVLAAQRSGLLAPAADRAVG